MTKKIIPRNSILDPRYIWIFAQYLWTDFFMFQNITSHSPHLRHWLSTSKNSPKYLSFLYCKVKINCSSYKSFHFAKYFTFTKVSYQSFWEIKHYASLWKSHWRSKCDSKSRCHWSTSKEKETSFWKSCGKKYSLFRNFTSCHYSYS